jgi:hypothetical protein
VPAISRHDCKQTQVKGREESFIEIFIIPRHRFKRHHGFNDTPIQLVSPGSSCSLSVRNRASFLLPPPTHAGHERRNEQCHVQQHTVPFNPFVLIPSQASYQFGCLEIKAPHGGMGPSGESERCTFELDGGVSTFCSSSGESV